MHEFYWNILLPMYIIRYFVFFFDFCMIEPITIYDMITNDNNSKPAWLLIGLKKIWPIGPDRLESIIFDIIEKKCILNL